MSSIASKPRRSAAVAAGMIFAAAVAIGSIPGSASAEQRGRDHRDNHHRDWNGRYYAAPPVVYGTPYYYAPPLFYGPGLNIYIR